MVSKRQLKAPIQQPCGSQTKIRTLTTIVSTKQILRTRFSRVGQLTCLQAIVHLAEFRPHWIANRQSSKMYLKILWPLHIVVYEPVIAREVQVCSIIYCRFQVYQYRWRCRDVKLVIYFAAVPMQKNEVTTHIEYSTIWFALGRSSNSWTNVLSDHLRA